MYVCPSEFDREDPENLGYSLCEVDWYAWIPKHPEVSNHRLSLRKNLKTGKYEVYRAYAVAVGFERKIGIGVISGVSNLPLGKEEIVFESGNLQEAIDFADKEYRRFHGERSWPTEVCQHKYPKKSILCHVEP